MDDTREFGKSWMHEAARAIPEESEDQLVERLARACAAQGGDPDQMIGYGSSAHPRWEIYRPDAKNFLAMFKALQDG